MTYALDTNTVSYFLRGEGNVRYHYNKEILQAGNPYAIPAAVVYEINRWLLYNPDKGKKSFGQEFNALFHNVRDTAEMSLDAWKKAAEIYIELKSKGQLIGDADILIASYCLVNGYTLVTRNISDFERIDGLKFANWH
ncbi:MAG: PIN domain-containing protein [Defluviitaleaceae bacterium]|nr:PIN domain-containing protein [Defluviitaleaceae bacterium]